MKKYADISFALLIFTVLAVFVSLSGCVTTKSITPPHEYSGLTEKLPNCQDFVSSLIAGGIIRAEEHNDFAQLLYVEKKEYILISILKTSYDWSAGDFSGTTYYGACVTKSHIMAHVYWKKAPPLQGPRG